MNKVLQNLLKVYEICMLDVFWWKNIIGFSLLVSNQKKKTD